MPIATPVKTLMTQGEGERWREREREGGGGERGVEREKKSEVFWIGSINA